MRGKRGTRQDVKCKFRTWLLKHGLLPGSAWPGSGLMLDPAWPTTPSPRSSLRSLPLPRYHLHFSNFQLLFLLSRQNAERERLVNEAHAYTLARTRSMPSSPFPHIVPTFPLPCRRYPSFNITLRCRHRRRRRCRLYRSFLLSPSPLPPPPPPRPQTQCATSRCLGVTVMTYSHMYARRTSDIAPSTSSGSGNGSGGGGSGDSIRGSSCSRLLPGSYWE